MLVIHFYIYEGWCYKGRFHIAYKIIPINLCLSTRRITKQSSAGLSPTENPRIYLSPDPLKYNRESGTKGGTLKDTRGV